MKQAPFGWVGILTIVGVIAWTLIPNSHSLMVMWPGVFFWQVVVGLPIIWLWILWIPLRQRSLVPLALGGGLDGLMGASIVVIVLSTIGSSSPQFSLWYGISALGAFAAVYALNRVVSYPGESVKELSTHPSPGAQFLWELQGWVGILFSLESLGLWWFKVYRPEHDRLRDLQSQYGVTLQFDFSQLDFQNWYPLGHQNYVAGYLILTLPLLLGLWLKSLVQGQKRYAWLWGIGVILQVLDLYSTSSRGGWLGLLGIFCGCLFIMSRFYTWRVIFPIVLGGIAVIFGAFWSNDRLRSFVLGLIQGKAENSQLIYRFITHQIGWNMVVSHPWTGLGLGSVPLLYQAYRPLWAGEEAELHYQLHSTPAQLWAELGIGGIAILLGLILLIIFQFLRWMQHQVSGKRSPIKRSQIERSPIADILPTFHPSTLILTWSSAASLLGYGLMALTDYQLDTISISGTFILSLVLFWRSVVPATQISTSKTIAIYRFIPQFIPKFTQKLIGQFKPRFSLHHFLSFGGIGISLAILLWLIPVHRAWATAQKGFEALGMDRRDGFVKEVSTAHRLAPWDPYYALQLGWNLGEFSTQSSDPQDSQILRQDAIQWFQKAIETAPFQEFSHSNLGWLFLQDAQPNQARLEFEKAVQLIPAKEGLWFALGLSEWLDHQQEAAIDSFVRELIRHPLGITNPLWQTNPLQEIQNQVFDRLDQYCSDGLEDSAIQKDEALINYLHSVRGGLRWWRNDFSGAEIDWKYTKNSLGLAILNLENSPNQTQSKILNQLADSPGKFLLQAWQDHPEKWLKHAWENSLQNSNVLPTLSQAIVLQSLQDAKAQNQSLGKWFRDLRHYQSYRFDRLGFGVLSRHLGGSIPKDYGLDYENLLITGFLPEIFPERSYFPVLDQKLQQSNG